MAEKLEREKLAGDKDVAGKNYESESAAYKLIITPYEREIYVITMIKIKINEHCDKLAKVARVLAFVFSCACACFRVLLRHALVGVSVCCAWCFFLVFYRAFGLFLWCMRMTTHLGKPGKGTLLMAFVYICRARNPPSELKQAIARRTDGGESVTFGTCRGDSVSACNASVEGGYWFDTQISHFSEFSRCQAGEDGTKPPCRQLEASGNLRDAWISGAGGSES